MSTLYRPFWWSLLLSIWLGFAPVAVQAEQAAPAAAQWRIAVLDFKPHNLPQGSDADMGRTIAERIEQGLAGDQRFRVISRAEVEKYIKDVALAQTGTVDAASAVQVGKQLQARWVVGGSLTKAGPFYQMSARLVEVETGTVLHAEDIKFRARTNIQEAVDKLMKTLLPRLGEVLAASPTPAGKSLLRVAVLDFKPYNLKAVKDKDLGRVIAENLEVALVKGKLFQVIERAEVDKLIKEVAFTQTGLVDPQSAIQVGKQLQARYLIAGSLTHVGLAYTINARLIDVQTGAMTAADNVKFAAPNRLQAAIDELVQRLGKNMTGAVAAAGPERLRIAVLEFRPYNIKMKIDPNMGRAIAESVEVGFTKDGHYLVIERAEVDKLSKEAAFSETGLIDPASAVQLGKQLQARYVVTGNLTRSRLFYSLSARLVDVQSGAVTSADDVRFLAPNRLQSAVEKLVDKLSKGLEPAK